MTRAAFRPAAWYRVLISLWGVWFATVLTEPAGLMACPLHSGHGAEHATASSHGGAHYHAASAVSLASTTNATDDGTEATHRHRTSHSAHAAHAADAATAATASPDAQRNGISEQAPSDGGHQCCTCLGQCCTAAPTAAVDATPTITVGVVRTVIQLATVHAVAHAPRRAYALPFANGPPTQA